MPRKQASPERETILEGLLRNLLDEVSIRDAQRRVTKQFCAGCKGKPLRVVNACQAAWQYLDSIDRERGEVAVVHGAAD